MRSKPLCNILVVIALTLSLASCGSGQFATEQTSEIQTDSYENSEPTQELDTGLEIPLEEVDYVERVGDGLAHVTDSKVVPAERELRFCQRLFKHQCIYESLMHY